MLQLNNRTKGILLGIGFLFIVFLVWYFSAIVTYILTSVVLAFIGKPIMHWLTRFRVKNFKIPKGGAALITLIIMLVVFLSFFRFIIPLIIREVNTLSQVNFTEVLDSIGDPVMQVIRSYSQKTGVLENKSFFDVLAQSLGDKINFSQVSNWISVVASTIGEVLVGFFSVSFITFFFLKEETLFRNMILVLVPTNIETKVSHILDSISKLLRRYFIGLLFEVFMVMLLNTLGLTIVGIGFDNAVVIGLICGLFNVIPYLGPWMGAAIGLLIGASINIDAEFMSHTLPVLGFMALVFALVQVIDNVLFQPLIYSSSVKAHPLEIFIVILAAGSMAGIIGMILAIPVYTILRVVAKEFFDNLKIVKKITENLDKERVHKDFHRKKEL